MRWKVNYYKDLNGKKPVEEWINTLDIKLKVKIFRLFELVEEFNINLKEPC